MAVYPKKTALDMLSPMKKPATRLSPTLLAILACACLIGVRAAVHAQTSVGAPSTSLTPGPKPADVSTGWKNLVGIYSRNKGKVVILEREGQLFLKPDDGPKFLIQNYADSRFLISLKSGPTLGASVQRDLAGNVTTLNLPARYVPPLEPRSDIAPPENLLRPLYFTRADAGSDPAHFYHVTPAKPVTELRAAALAAQPPSEAGPFREPDLVELATLDPGFHLDIRYAQSNNFLSTPVYTQARAFMQRPAAEALLRALNKLKPLGYGLLIHDAYRPWYVTKIFWDATPPESHNFVADPKKGSKHNRGCAVDITLYDLATNQPIEMPGLYDEMSPRSFPDFPGGTSLQRWHRDLLRRAIESEGFTVDTNEWWHFDYKEWKHYPILNLPFEDLSAVSPSR